MGSASVVISCGTRRGVHSDINQDVIGLNGWVLHADSFAVFPPWSNRELALQVGNEPVVIVVADGIGGIAESHTASLIVAEESSRPAAISSSNALAETLNAAHRRIRAIADDRPAAHSIGSTVVGLRVGSNGLLVRFNLGDSRFYFTNADTLVQGAREDREPLAFSTRKRLSRWIGQPEVDVIEPFFERMEPVDERRVLLCSDGLAEAVDEPTMQAIVCNPRLGPAAVVQQLLDAAGDTPDDDVTAVVVHVSVTTPNERVVADEPAKAVRSRRPDKRRRLPIPPWGGSR